MAPIILAWANWQWWLPGTWWWWHWWRFESLTSMLLQPGWCLVCFPTVISCLRQHFYLASSFEQAEEKCNPSIFLKEIKLWPSSSNQRGESCHLMTKTTLPPFHRTFLCLFPRIKISRSWVRTFFFNCFHEDMGMMIPHEGDKAKQRRFLSSSTSFQEHWNYILIQLYLLKSQTETLFSSPFSTPCDL